MDQRHSIEVTLRFKAIRPEASIPEVRAALLHDVGKIPSSLGVLARVLATVVGKRGQKFTAYHDHQRLGGEMLEEISSDPFTVKLVRGTNNTGTDINIAETLLALKRADDLVT
ncbi:MAG: HD domain-containing protein [Acidimicrobiaceae bacterium]|nr:HD domain-containing protein [Acidimicrobiaceae bacterium]